MVSENTRAGAVSRRSGGSYQAGEDPADQISDRFGQVRTRFTVNLSELDQVQDPTEPVQT